ncbi:unnamed protein product [Owenia fusiformis]|uniref:Uncharacterized protein n=1 Tax=Owenia fusiformis TaxID=6347 RepID=A0A8J1U012_OWEFU|nr:unnamed protein product [Owenia fusiformis]
MLMTANLLFMMAALANGMYLPPHVTSKRATTITFTECDVLDDTKEFVASYKRMEIPDMILVANKLRGDMSAVGIQQKSVDIVKQIIKYSVGLTRAIGDVHLFLESHLMYYFYFYPSASDKFDDYIHYVYEVFGTMTTMTPTHGTNVKMSALSSRVFGQIQRKANLFRGELNKARRSSTVSAENKKIVNLAGEELYSMTKKVYAVRNNVNNINRQIRLLANEARKSSMQPRTCASSQCNCGTRGRCINIANIYNYCSCDLGYSGSDCSVRADDRSAYQMCKAYGEVHYRSLDGAHFDFQGNCHYLLLSHGFQLTDPPQKTVVYEVFQKNWIKPGGNQVAWPKITYIHLNAGNDIFEIGQRLQNGEPDVKRNNRALSKEERDAGIELDYLKEPVLIVDDGRFTTINIQTYGVKIVFDGDWDSYVYVLKEFGTNELAFFDGMCGNFDGQADNDYTAKGSTKVLKAEDNYGRTIGNSYQVEYDSISSSKGCAPTTLPDMPKLTDLKKVKLTEVYCRIADCGGDDSSSEWRACVADTYFSVSEKAKCDLLKREIHAKSDCSDTPFNCTEVIHKAHRELGLHIFN